MIEVEHLPTTGPQWQNLKQQHKQQLIFRHWCIQQKIQETCPFIITISHAAANQNVKDVNRSLGLEASASGSGS